MPSAPLFQMPRARRRPLVRAAVIATLLVTAAGVWLAAQPAAPRQPFLWKAQRAGAPPVWLFGTIHVPDARVQALPAVVADAFRDATHVVTEIPLDLEAQLSVSGQLLLPANDSLQTLVGEARFSRLVTVISAALAEDAPAIANLVIGALDRLKPWAAMAQLSLLDYLPEVLAGRPSLDARLYADASSAGKRLSSLETIDDQARVFDVFTADEQVALLEAALVQAEEGRAAGQAPSRLLVDRYLTGDAALLADAVDEQAPADAALAAKFTRVLLHERNRRMIERFERLRAEHPDDVYFVAVGTLHLVGAAGLPALFEARGYRVERVTSSPNH